MKTEEYDHLMTFTSHYRALYIYDRLVKREVKTKLVKAPNKLNISCTQAIKFNEIDKEIIKKELQNNNIYPTGIYKIIYNGKYESYELIE
ncbi:MAG: DUF3343 domain-containing protein [Clostridiales bacterium]|nr:DUF3343 domain-containing protein [Clostridiales bacterium]